MMLEDPERKQLGINVSLPSEMKDNYRFIFAFLRTLSPIGSRCEEQINISVNVFMFPWKDCASPPGYSETKGNDKVLALVVQVLVKGEERPPLSELAELLSCSTRI